MAVAVRTLRDQATEELELLLRTEGSGFPRLKWAVLSLQAPGKLLSSNKVAFAWGLLPLLVIEAAGGDPKLGLPLAAAVECLIAASDVFDDIEDGDSPTGLERLCGIPTAINVGLFLACMAQLAIHRLTDRGADARVARNVGRALATAGARACSGQQQDIDQDDALLTEAGYLAMVQAKSGALVEGVCRAAVSVLPLTVLSAIPEAFGLPSLVRPQLAALSMIAFPLAVAYAIVRHQLLDIDVVISRTFGVRGHGAASGGRLRPVVGNIQADHARTNRNDVTGAGRVVLRRHHVELHPGPQPLAAHGRSPGVPRSIQPRVLSARAGSATGIGGSY